MGLKELAEEELTAFGYTITDSDDALISLCVQKSETYIKNDINQDTVPHGLMPFAANMVCGEFLSIKKTFSPESITGLDLSAAVKRIQVGDTSTEFAADSSQTAAGQLDSVISALQNSGKSQMPCFRKLRW